MDEKVVVELTVYERNAAANALSDKYLNPRSDQQNPADRAYYKLIDAQPRSSLGDTDG